MHNDEIIAAYQVQKGDSLSAIVRDALGPFSSHSDWMKATDDIYEFNKRTIKDKNLIYPGQIIAFPLTDGTRRTIITQEDMNSIRTDFSDMSDQDFQVLHENSEAIELLTSDFDEIFPQQIACSEATGPAQRITPPPHPETEVSWFPTPLSLVSKGMKTQVNAASGKYGIMTKAGHSSFHQVEGEVTRRVNQRIQYIRMRNPKVLRGVFKGERAFRAPGKSRYVVVNTRKGSGFTTFRKQVKTNKVLAKFFSKRAIPLLLVYDIGVRAAKITEAQGTGHVFQTAGEESGEFLFGLAFGLGFPVACGVASVLTVGAAGAACFFVMSVTGGTVGGAAGKYFGGHLGRTIDGN